LVSSRDQHGYLPAHQIGCHSRQPVVTAFGPAKLDGDVLAVDVASLFQTRAEAGDVIHEWLRRRAVEKPDHRQHGLLGTRRKRPCCRRTADKRDEFAPLHVSPSGHAASNIYSLALFDRTASRR
jgi:hypothetical protein